MPTIALDVQRRNLVSDCNVALTACRARAQVQFRTKAGARRNSYCIADSGAPLNVIPFSLWQGLNLPWTNLGNQLFEHGRLVPGALDWTGIPCELGETIVNLVDPTTGVIAGPFRLVGKFPRQPHPDPALERIALLGLNFLTDNFHLLGLDGGTGDLLASLSVP